MTKTTSPESLDLLTAVPVATVTSKSLRSGSILVDEFDTPSARLVERLGQQAGCAIWLYEDLASGEKFHASFAISLKATIRVMA